MEKPSLKKKNVKSLNKTISGQFQKTLKQSLPSSDNPVVRAAFIWTIVTKQLEEILGHEIYNKWFSSIIPMVVSDNILILQSQKDFNVRWINQHYQKLVDLLISFQDKKLSSFFISPSDKSMRSKPNPRPKIESKRKYK